MGVSWIDIPFKDPAFMFVTACLFAAAVALPQTLPQQPPAAASSSTVSQREKALNAVFSDYWEQELKDSPEFASSLGDKRYDDQLSDYSVAGYNSHLEHDRGFLDRLGAIDSAGLPDQEQLSKDLLVRKLIDEQEEARFKPWEMPVNQFNGLQLGLPQLVPLLSFDSEADYEHYIARLGRIPTAFTQITDDMMTGMDDNRVPPKYLLEKVLVQVNTLAQQKPEDSPFALPLKKFPAAISAAQQQEIRQQVLAAIAKQVLPAYARFGRFLKAQYVPHGRTEPGIWSLTDGDAYYRFRVRMSTTTDLTPDQIHKIGEQQVADDEAQMTAIAKKLGFADLKALRASIPNNPKLHATSPEALIAVYRGYIDGMKPKLPQLFGRLPTAPLDIKPVPDFMAKDQAAAYYEDGTPDGKRPGAFFVNTYNYAQRSLTTAEAVAYHEGLPGHHLQISIAQELTDVPEFRKHNYYTAYTEGWGLYAERLGKDVGFYTILTATMAAWRPTSGGRSGWWSTPACTQSTGAGSRWSTTSTSIPPSTTPMCRRRWTVTSRGRGRRWATRSASSSSWNSEPKRRKRWDRSSTSADSTTPSSTPARCRWTSWSSGWTRGSHRSRALTPGRHSRVDR